MVSSDDAAATLFEALALWRNNLEAQQSQQESTLPRKGKNPATSGDEELERQRRIHLETVDRCLRVIPEMAAVIAKQPGATKATDSVYTVPPLTPPDFPEEWEIGPENYKNLSCGDEEPYVNPFTGNMIYPASWEHTAGPSGTRSPPRSQSPQLSHGARAASERQSQGDLWPTTKPEWCPSGNGHTKRPAENEGAKPPAAFMRTERDSDSDSDSGSDYEVVNNNRSSSGLTSSSLQRDRIDSSWRGIPPPLEVMPQTSSRFPPNGTRTNARSFSNSHNDSSDSDDDGPLPVAGAIHRPGPPTPPKVPLVPTTSSTAASDKRSAWGLAALPPYPTYSSLTALRRPQPPTRSAFASASQRDFGNYFGSHWGGLDHKPVPGLSTYGNGEGDGHTVKRETKPPPRGYTSPFVTSADSDGSDEDEGHTVKRETKPPSRGYRSPFVTSADSDGSGEDEGHTVKRETKPPSRGYRSPFVTSADSDGSDEDEGHTVKRETKPPSRGYRTPFVTSADSDGSDEDEGHTVKRETKPPSRGYRPPFVKPVDSGDDDDGYDGCDDMSLEEKERARLKAQYAADLAYAAHLARTDIGSDDDSDDDDVEYARLVEEQRSLLNAFELYGGVSQVRRERELAHARRMQEYENRRLVEQEAFARRVRDDWLAAIAAQEREDRLLAEQCHREEEEIQMRQKREYEELKRIIEEEEARIRAEEEERERIRREMMAECAVCAEEYDKTDMAILPCSHAYCKTEDCLQTPFNIALKDKKPFTCCGERVDITHAEEQVTPEFVSSYELMLLELDTPNPLYCPTASCSAFIPPAQIVANIGTCSKCATTACGHCKGPSHSGVCAEDTEGQKVRNLAKAEGWMECPNCKHIVERNTGCLHMTCKCLTEFCYNCGSLYGNKPGQCGTNCTRNR